MNFCSDNTAGAAPEILAALSQVNDLPVASYGEDPWSRRLQEEFSKVFEREVSVFAVATGTAANALALASVTPPWGGIICHRESHVERDEAGAVEFFTGGAKLVTVDGPLAMLSPLSVEEALSRSDGSVHQWKPAAISISQSTERGALYRPEEVAALSAIAKREGLALHMDGARLANAIAALGCSPADVTWRAGVDLVSFGATKNGALGAEAVVMFDTARAEEFARRRKRAGHLTSKSRFVAAQLLAYVQDGLWLRLAARANTFAAQIGDAAGAVLSAPVMTNQAFIRPGEAALAKLRAAGVLFYDWGARGSGEARFVVSWNQNEADVIRLCALLRALA